MACCDESGLRCELRIIRGEKVEELTKKLKGGCVFVRMHLSDGGNKNARVQLNTRELLLCSSRPRDSFTWDESFTLECKGTEESVNRLKRGSVSVELRWRPSSSSGSWVQSSSKLLSRVEMPWEPAFCSPGSEIQAWLPFHQQIKPSGLLVAIKVVELVGGIRRRRSRHERCTGCPGSYSQDNYALFALPAA